MDTNRIQLTYIALILALLFWGLSFVLTKIALSGFTVFSLIFIRFGIASVFFIVLMAWRGFPRFSPKDHLKVFIIAIFEPWLYFIFETTGLQYSSASKASLIIATIPIFVLVLSTVFFKEKAGFRKIAGIGISLVGVSILIVGDPNINPQVGSVMLGDFLILGAVISAAFYIILVRSLGKTHSVIQITGMQIIYGALLFAPEFFWELPDIKWTDTNLQAVLALAVLTLCATIGAFLCYNFALSRIPATTASIFLNGIPVVTAIAAWALLGEQLTLFQITGGFIVLLAVYLTTTNNNSPPRKAVISELSKPTSGKNPAFSPTPRKSGR